MSEPTPAPVLTREQRLEVELLSQKIRVAELEFQLAEQRLMTADKVAALRSKELTDEKAALYDSLETPAWRYDFERGEFVRKG